MAPQNEVSQARPEGSELVRSKAAGVPKGCHWHAGISIRNHGLDSRLKQAKTSHLRTQVMTKAWRVKKLANILDTKVIQRALGSNLARYAFAARRYSRLSSLNHQCRALLQWNVSPPELNDSNS